MRGVCINGWTLLHFHIWSHIHAEYGSDGCHICKIHVKYSARAARSLAMHVIKSLAESHLRKVCRRKSHPGSHPCRIFMYSYCKSSHLKSHPNHIRNHIHAESIHFQPLTLPARRPRPAYILIIYSCMHANSTNAARAAPAGTRGY